MNRFPEHDPQRPSPASDQALERLIGQLLRDQPLRRAPDSLEARVLAQLRRRAARPWWHYGFSHWPAAARIAFVATSLACAMLGLRLAEWIASPLEASSFASGWLADIHWIEAFLAAMAALVRYLPPGWVYGLLIVFGLMYATLFGIGAAAYRTLYASR